MRIAYVCADLGIPVFGRKGCSIHVQEVVRALTGHGAQVELFAMCPEGSPPPGLEDVRLHALPKVPRIDRAAREWAAVGANREVRTLLEQEGPFDMVYERYSLWSFAGMEYARSCDRPGLLEVNAPLIEEQAAYRELLDRAAAEAVAKCVFFAASALIAVSDEVAAWLNSYPAACGRVHVIANGVHPQRFLRNGSGPGSQANGFTVGFAGSLKPWHGLSILVDAFEQVRRHAADARLLIVGDGPERPALEVQLLERGLREVTELTGAVAASEVPEFLAAMDVAVAPYPKLAHFYFSPLKVYEYMAAGLPVVASGIGQLASLIVPEFNGLLCPPGDAGALANALLRLREDRPLRSRLGQAARATVMERHTWEAVTQRILDLGGLVESGV